MDLQIARTLMKDAIHYLESEFGKMQVGRASTSMVDEVLVQVYGSSLPMKNVATITTPDPKTIMIQPWDKAILTSLEKSIRDQSDLGLNPLNDGNVLRIVIPQPTEERRQDLVKVAHSKAEDAKVSVRNARHKTQAFIRTQMKNKEISENERRAMEKELQEEVELSNNKIDDLLKTKEKEILTV